MKFFDIEKVVRSCYQPKDPPVILTSGKVLSPFFLNGHMFLEDGIEYKKYEMNPVYMKNYALKRYNESENFRNSIEYAVDIIKKQNIENLGAISGGRTRDWPFAAVIAHQLKLPFLALFKPQDNIESQLLSSSQDNTLVKNISDYSVLNNIYHIVDLTTDGGSIIKQNGGWVPQIREKNGTIENVMAFISRNPNNIQTLKKYGIDFKALTTIDKTWLDQYDKINAQINAQFAKQDPIEWTINQLKKMTDPSILSRYFDKNNPTKDVTIGKDNRALIFLYNYKHILHNTGMWDKINDEIKNKYNRNLDNEIENFIS